MSPRSLLWIALMLAPSFVKAEITPAPMMPREQTNDSSFFYSASAFPRAYLNGGYHMNLTVKEMRIDHMAVKTSCPLRQRQCTLALAYSQPIGTQLFSSRFDVPILSSQAMASSWSSASVGDYVLHLSNVPLRSPALQLVANAHF